jgi:Na+/H+ antiporter NhaD/arsenite permease-like protein
MPETKHISIWKEVRDLKPAYLNNHVRHQVWRRTLFSENAPLVAGRFLFGPESQAACELKNDLAAVRLPRSSTALDQRPIVSDAAVELLYEQQRKVWYPIAHHPRSHLTESIQFFGIPFDFFPFALTLLGIALFHRHTLPIALGGLAVIVAYKLGFTGFKDGPGLAGLGSHLGHEFSLLSNLFLLLMGFALLSRHFEESAIPDEMPALLPDDWTGGVLLLITVFVLSSFLDNIAGAIIGGTMARHVFRGKVHMGYLAAIVAASNAGGAGSVVGDTTTTMMWVSGVSPLSVLEAYIAAVVALLIFAIPASLQQQRYSPIVKQPRRGPAIDWVRVFIVASMLAVALVANVVTNLHFPELLYRVPVLGLSVWAVLLATAPLRRPDWKVLPETFKGTVFLLALVTAASMMPVETLPAASWQTTLGLGFVSAVFDNIPLTALALKQGGYDWGYLAYAVGFGGSMIWFGSSAGVALSNQYPEARSVGSWLRHGWHVAVGYVVGFLVMLVILGWHPDPSVQK